MRSRSGSIIDSPEQVGGYPSLEKGTPPTDTDRDGMPDEWEETVGLNPKDPSDSNRDRNADGYKNIEEYLHALLKGVFTPVARSEKRSTARVRIKSPARGLTALSIQDNYGTVNNCS